MVCGEHLGELCRLIINSIQQKGIEILNKNDKSFDIPYSLSTADISKIAHEPKYIDTYIKDSLKTKISKHGKKIVLYFINYIILKKLQIIDICSLIMIRATLLISASLTVLIKHVREKFKISNDNPTVIAMSGSLVLKSKMFKECIEKNTRHLLGN